MSVHPGLCRVMFAHPGLCVLRALGLLSSLGVLQFPVLHLCSTAVPHRGDLAETDASNRIPHGILFRPISQKKLLSRYPIYSRLT